MKWKTAADLFDQALQLYHHNQYGEAYRLLVENAAEFPEEAYRLSHWQMCMAALAGQERAAVDVLENALRAGLWYPEPLLRDPDLAALQGQERFEALARQSQQKFVEAQSQTKPLLEVIAPAGPAPYPLLMAIHGNNSNLSLTRPVWQPAASLGWLLALAQSSQLGGPDRFIWDDHDKSTAELQAHTSDLLRRYPIDPRSVVLGGFSMGGRLAAWLALSGALKVSGFFAVVPYVPEIETWSEMIERAGASRLRGYILIGADDTVSGAGPVELAKRLQAAGAACEVEVVAGLGHAYPADFPAILQRALEFIRPSLAADASFHDRE